VPEQVPEPETEADVRYFKGIAFCKSPGVAPADGGEFQSLPRHEAQAPDFYRGMQPRAESALDPGMVPAD